ncbi:MAG: hypothetical protein QHC65_04225 [Sphingomonas sp.]|nr:hypothetical protein [Sphingomonas sp.]MDX3883605.1 hypothetical protein [Sphingomonas sp.]
MADYVAIANLAASKLGEDDQLRSPDDDTHLGRTVKAVWDQVRQDAIRDYNWNFAMRRKGLAAEALPAVPYPWAFSFPLPAGCLRLVEVLSLPSRRSYQLEGGSILCNQAGPLFIRFLVDVTEPAQWDAGFAGAMAARLAYEIADRITGDLDRKDMAWRDYQAVLARAKRKDARENPPEPFEPTEWETARYDGDVFDPAWRYVGWP